MRSRLHDEGAHRADPQFIKGNVSSAEINRLTVAYAKALGMLDLIDRNDPVAEIVAKKVVEVGTSGTTDPQEVAEKVVAYFHSAV